MEAYSYVAASNIAEAIAWGNSPQTCYLAGGTDLLIKMKTGKLLPSVLVDLKKIPGFTGITVREQQVEIGALTTLREIETSPIIAERLNILSSAAGKLGSVQVRNRATIGGNICNAAPSAETAPALLCLEAKAEIIGSRGIRTVPMEEFFTGPGKTVLQEGEILSRIIVPVPSEFTKGIYFKLSVRKAMDIAFVGVAVLMSLAGGQIVKARIGLGAVAPIPMRSRKAEALLEGKYLSEDLVLEAADLAAGESRPIDDIRASAAYRQEMVRALTAEGLRQLSSGGLLGEGVANE